MKEGAFLRQIIHLFPVTKFLLWDNQKSQLYSRLEPNIKKLEMKESFAKYFRTLISMSKIVNVSCKIFHVQGCFWDGGSTLGAEDIAKQYQWFIERLNNCSGSVLALHTFKQFKIKAFFSRTGSI